MQKNQLLWAGLLMLCLGCTTNEAADREVPADTRYATQVSVGNCAFVPPEAGKKFLPGVAAAIGASAISQGVNYLGEALAEAGKEKTWETIASRNFETSKANFPGCIQIARGVFHVNPAAKIVTEEPAWVKSDAERGRSALWNVATYQTLAMNGLWLAEKPDFFFEGMFRGSQDKQSLTIEPVVVLMENPIGSRALLSNSARNIAIFAALHTSGTPPTLKTTPAISLVLGHISSGAPLRLRTTADAWDDGAGATLPGAPASVPFEAAWFKLSKTDAVTPLTASVLVTESESGNDFLAFLGKVFSEQSTKTAISTALQNAVIPERREAAEQSARQEETTALNAADTTLADTIAKLRDCSETSGKVEEAAARALSAMREANLAALAIGKGERFSANQINQIQITAGPDAIKTACSAVLDAI